MWERNNGQGEANILQNQFTAYLQLALRRQKITYLRKNSQFQKHEVTANLDDIFALTCLAPENHIASPEQSVLDKLALTQTLAQVKERELRVFFARALEECGFDELGAELGISYKGAAAVYYRVCQKLRQSLEAAV